MVDLLNKLAFKMIGIKSISIYEWLLTVHNTVFIFLTAFLSAIS